MDGICQLKCVNRELHYCGVVLVETFPNDRGSEGIVQFSIYMNVVYSYPEKVKNKPCNNTNIPPNNDTLNTPTNNNKSDLSDELEEALLVLEQG